MPHDERPDWERERSWMQRVHAMMRAGFGVEDIAHKTGSSLDSVREEARILRVQGELDELYRGRRR